MSQLLSKTVPQKFDCYALTYKITDILSLITHLIDDLQGLFGSSEVYLFKRMAGA